MKEVDVIYRVLEEDIKETMKQGMPDELAEQLRVWALGMAESIAAALRDNNAAKEE